MTRKLSTEGYVCLIKKFADDFFHLVDSDEVPSELQYTIKYMEEPSCVIRSARKAALSKFASYSSEPLRKFAFDTRRIDQENDRIPRSNLQHWHRTDPFITDEQHNKMLIFSKVFEAVKTLKNIYGTSPDWHDSYARILYDTVDRTLCASKDELDISSAQMSYLEQLIDARYRLRLEEIEKISAGELRERILAKDEGFFQRNMITNSNVKNEKMTVQSVPEVHNHIVVDGNHNNVDNNVLAQLFGGKNIVRKEGERVIERTITIKIRDEVIE